MRSFASAAFAGSPTRSGRSRPGIRGARMNGLFERSEMSHVGLACSTGRADGHRQPQTHAMQPPHAGSHTRPPAVLVTGDSDSLLVADKAPDEGGAPRGTFEDGARPGPRIITWSISSRTGHLAQDRRALSFVALSKFLTKCVFTGTNGSFLLFCV